MGRKKFVLNQVVTYEEKREYEFKEVIGSNPISAISKNCDIYTVAFLNCTMIESGSIFYGIRDNDGIVVGISLNRQQRDELRRIVTDKLSGIVPPISPNNYSIEMHPIYDSSNEIINELFIIEIKVKQGKKDELYFTGSSDAYIKTDAGKKKLNAIEISDEIIKRKSEIIAVKKEKKKSLPPRQR